MATVHIEVVSSGGPDGVASARELCFREGIGTSWEAYGASGPKAGGRGGDSGSGRGIVTIEVGEPRLNDSERLGVAGRISGVQA